MEKYPGFGAHGKKDMFDLIEAGRIQTFDGFNASQVGPASIDITVSGEHAYELDFFPKPHSRHGERIHDLLHAYNARTIRIGNVMWPGKTYVMPSSIGIDFPPGLYAFGNAKSSSGRNMFFSRLIGEGAEGYDTFDRRERGFTTRPWLVIEPQVYPIQLTNTECYSQMRIFDGDTRFTDTDLRAELRTHDFILRQDGSKYVQGELSHFSNDGSVFTTLYAKAGRLIGFRARQCAKPLDLTARNLDPMMYFEPVYAEPDPSNPTGGIVKLEPGYFYLFSTNEMLNVPDHLAAELIMMNPRFGLVFTHFAGFFDPGFCGVPTLEVAVLTPTILRHKDIIGQFRSEHMRSPTESYGNGNHNYQAQRRTTLPKQFAMPEEWREAMT